jgi:hypothetical protein
MNKLKTSFSMSERKAIRFKECLWIAIIYLWYMNVSLLITTKS